MAGAISYPYSVCYAWDQGGNNDSKIRSLLLFLVLILKLCLKQVPFILLREWEKKMVNTLVKEME